MTISRLRPAAFLLAMLPLASSVHAQTSEPACRYLQTAKLPIRYSDFSLMPTIEGQIDGTPATMMVDTGANTNYLTRPAAERRGITLNMSGQYVQGIGGTTIVYSARLKDFSIGPSHSGKTALPVLGEMGGTTSYDAIVGASFLLQMDMEIALADKQLKFFRPSGCGDTFLAYWDKDAMEIPFATDFGKSMNPHFTVEVNGTKLDAMIDSGAQRSVMGRKAAERAGVKIGAPGTTQGGQLVGAGAARVASWNGVFDTFTLGTETIRNASIVIEDSADRPGPDVLLGDDFLRAHRVLFAMSQQRLYISYLGGEVFTHPRTTPEPWIVREAEAGNAYAQLSLARFYLGDDGKPKDPAQSELWLNKAADQGNPQAKLLVGRKLMVAHRYADAAVHLRGALDQLPGERYYPLWLYLARYQAGDGALAKTELAARFADGQDSWPAPLAEFFLGRIDIDTLLAQAAKQKPRRFCEASSFAAELHTAQGDHEGAKALLDAARPDCARPVKK